MQIEPGKTTKQFNRRCIGYVLTGDCHADCCGPLVMSDVDFEGLAHRARDGYQVEKAPGSALNVYTIDGQDCPFIRLESRRCKIYSKRPEVCRKFGDESSPTMTCPHLSKSGGIRPEKLHVGLDDARKKIAQSLREI